MSAKSAVRISVSVRPEGAQAQRVGRGRALLTVILAALALVTGGIAVAPTAAADDSTQPDCLYVPQDIWGFRFKFYCAQSGSSGVYRQEGPHANGGLGECGDRVDNVVGNAVIGAFEEFFWTGDKGTKTECTKGRMHAWLKDHAENVIFGTSPGMELKDSPCQPLKGDREKLCVNPVDNNPCLKIGSKPFVGDKQDAMKARCAKEHPHFKQDDLDTASVGCDLLEGQDKKNCEIRKGELKANAPTDKDVQDDMEKLLGFALLAALTAGGVMTIVTGASFAFTWYTGRPGLVQFARLGWVFASVIVATGASGIVLLFLWTP